jgi:ammonia channel protein AmtB
LPGITANLAAAYTTDAAAAAKFFTAAADAAAGDLLCALLLAWSHRYPDNLAAAVEHAVAGLQGVLQLTAAAAGPEVRPNTLDWHVKCMLQACEVMLLTQGHCRKCCKVFAAGNIAVSLYCFQLHSQLPISLYKMQGLWVHESSMPVVQQ